MTHRRSSANQGQIFFYRANALKSRTFHPIPRKNSFYSLPYFPQNPIFPSKTHLPKSAPQKHGEASEFYAQESRTEYLPSSATIHSTGSGRYSETAADISRILTLQIRFCDFAKDRSSVAAAVELEFKFEIRPHRIFAAADIEVF